jgi:hypothetical protein
LTFRELASLLDITSIEEDIHRAVHRKPAATEIRTVVAVYRRFVETARSPYNQTSLISRHRLELGISVYVSAFSRFASAAAKQSVKDIFFTTFNSPAIPTTLGRQELYSGIKVNETRRRSNRSRRSNSSNCLEAEGFKYHQREDFSF